MQAPQVSLTPFYDRFVRQPEQAAATAASITQRGQIPPTPQLPDPQQLLRAMITTESGGDPNAVSPKGARGLMQVMPSTAMKPGFNLPNVFEFARQNGVEVGKENEAEAKRLLAIPALGANYGLRIMDAMLERYNGNLNYALAAYNAGPGRID
jgi:soluble lytic murein transglycosylase-like protein